MPDFLATSVPFPPEAALVWGGGSRDRGGGPLGSASRRATISAADDLEALSGELQQEAEELKTIEQASRKQRRARSLN